jgi:dolichyl-phosphate beta-glucosyltransferase
VNVVASGEDLDPDRDEVLRSGRAMQEAIVVVPCYNEEHRLDTAAFLSLAREPGVGLLFVDDGSTDHTVDKLRTLADDGEGRVAWMSLPKNRGKGEAVREGLRVALAGGARIVGYMDADGSTPGSEVARLLDEMRARDVSVIFGARVALLGNDIQRKRYRHYLGRVFATAASIILRLPVYDTQCGAKFFRDSPALREALGTPFVSRWAFDVELIGRLLVGNPAAGVAPLGSHEFLEVPLRVWHDVAGSKLRLGYMVKTGFELAAIGVRLRRKP